MLFPATASSYQPKPDVMSGKMMLMIPYKTDESPSAKLSQKYSASHLDVFNSVYSVRSCRGPATGPSLQILCKPDSVCCVVAQPSPEEIWCLGTGGSAGREVAALARLILRFSQMDAPTCHK